MKAKFAVVIALIVGLFVGFSVKYYKVNQASYKLGYEAGADAVWHEAYLSGNTQHVTNPKTGLGERQFIIRNTLYNPPEGRDVKHGYLASLKEGIDSQVRVMKEDLGLEDNPNR